MTPGAWKLASMGLVLMSGAAGGVWLAACHYRPLLDTANTGLATARQTRDNLETLAVEQGRKLGELVIAGVLRERNAALASAKAKEEARLDHAAANRLLQERTGGDPPEAALSIIDQELGL